MATALSRRRRAYSVPHSNTCIPHCENASEMPRERKHRAEDPGGEGLGRPRRAQRRRRARPALHRPAPRARGDQPAGLRRPARWPGRTVRRPDLTIATEDHNVPTLDILAADRRPGQPRPDRDAADATAAEFGIRLHPMGDRDQGIVHVIGPQLGLTQPGMTIVCGDSHTAHPRRLRRAGLRHRHQRGRARAGHPDAAAGPAEADGGHRRRRAAAGRHGQGHHPGASSPRSAPAAASATSSSTAAGHRGAVDGGPHDDLQHVDRGGRQGRPDRPRRDDVRLPGGPPARARRAPSGTPPSSTGDAAHRRRTPSSTARWTSTPPR